MLYIGNNKIIKGYIGDIPVTHVSLGNRSLIKLELIIVRNFTPKCTDFSVLPGSTIIIEYTSEGVSSSDITVTYDESFFTKDGDSFTLIAEGYSEITYNVKGLPSVVIRVATAELEADKGATLDYTSSLPSYPSHIDATYYVSSKNYNFSIRSKQVTASSKYETALWSYSPRNVTCSGFLKLDMSGLNRPFYISVTYSSESSSSNDTFKIYVSESSTVNTSVLNTLVSTWGNKSNVTVKSPSYSKAGSYYLHFSSTKKSSYGSDYLLGIKEIKIIHTRETSVYPATQIVTESQITPYLGTNFTIDATLIPSNANEEITYTPDLTSKYLTKRDDKTFIIWGYVNPFNIECKGKYVSNTVNVKPTGGGKSDLVIVYTSIVNGYYPKATDKASDWWETTTDNGSSDYTAIITASTLPTTLKFDVLYNNLAIKSIDYIRTNNITDMSYMFEECNNLTSIGNLSVADTSNVSNMFAMFRGCSILSWLDLSWNTSNVTDMGSMFENCSSLNELYVSSWDTSNVYNMLYMFSNCSNLYSLDLSNWYTYNVSDMSYMFNGCSNLYELYLNNFDMSMYPLTDYMFSGCYNLTYLHLDYCSYDTVDKIINSTDFPVDNYGTIYCSWDTYNNLTPPGNWTFEAV